MRYKVVADAGKTYFYRSTQWARTPSVFDQKKYRKTLFLSSKTANFKNKRYLYNIKFGRSKKMQRLLPAPFWN